jgi:hypothetical protein
MNFKKVFSKIINKEALLIIDIVVCPILALLFFGPITDFIPNFIFDFNGGYFELPFRVAMFSIPISLIYFVVLLSLKKGRLVKMSIFVLIGIVGSLTIGIFIMSALAMLLYALSQMFGLK